MRARALLACCAAASVLANCAGADLAKTVSPDKVSTSTKDASAAAAQISKYRLAHGLAPVSVDARLNSAAVHQARAVAEAGSLSHGSFASRMNTFGIAGYAAENLTAGSGSVDAAIGRWKASPNHNANLLMPEARHVGLARADTPGAGYGHYWALVLAQ